MTKEEFKKKWDSDETHGGITYDDIVNCAIKWKICSSPRTHDIFKINRKVLKATNCKP